MASRLKKPSSERAATRRAAALQAKIKQLKAELEIERQENESYLSRQRELEASRERYLHFLDIAPAGYLVLSSNGIIHEINLYILTVFNHSRSAILGRRLQMFVDKADRKAVLRHFGDLRRGKSPVVTELRLAAEHVEGRVFELRTILSGLEAGACGVRRCYSILTDITERKQVQEKLKQLAQFPEQNPDPVLRITTGGDLLYSNSPARSMLKVLGMGARGPLPHALRKLASDAESQLHSIEGEVVESTGRTYSINAVRPPGETYVNLYGRDITSKKQAEASLRQSEARWNAAIENFAEGAIIATEDERVVYGNPAARAMHGFTSPDEGIGPLEKAPITFQLWTPDGTHMLDLEEWPMRRIKRGETVRDLELCIRRPDQGWEKIFSYFGAMVDTADGERLIFLTCRDLTDLRKTEEALKKSLQEKEVLLKEIHHRVKNNMQIISSLIDLKAGQLGDSVMRAVLQDVTNRVQSMALVHEKLYQSTDLSRIDFAEYIENLLTYIWRAQETAVSNIQLVLELEPTMLSINTAVPCGLILNELATNALKHAFQGLTSGEVKVSLHADPEGELAIVVRDNGKGLPSNFNWKQAKSLGLSLVQILAKQISAKLEIVNGEGTEFSIRVQS
jgi:PAS domain S-box-containing protein